MCVDPSMFMVLSKMTGFSANAPSFGSGSLRCPEECCMPVISELRRLGPESRRAWTHSKLWAPQTEGTTDRRELGRGTRERELFL